MTMFKCNHDVQVLFGGKDAINRIYYCCKYVTKHQRQIDSATTVALASFQRRQAKEAVDFASDTPPAVMDVQRRRVAGMVHTLTNKQEFDGPLAAMYLFSCNYASAMRVKLPLSAILKQLVSSGKLSRPLRCKDGMASDGLEDYAKIALVLFKPFRNLNNFLGVYED
jgi:hypothetical protein